MTEAKTSTRTDCVIVGAGMAGLMAAHALREAGRSCVLLDKGRGVGGRMATRRFGGAVFDHGAQFFTVRDEAFAGHVRSWLEDGHVVTWSRGFPGAPDGTGGPGAAGTERNDEGHPRYRGKPSMTAVPKRLAEGLEVRCGGRVNRLDVEAGGWRVQSESGLVAGASALLLTSPVPQSLALLGESGIRLDAEVDDALQRIDYDPCLALMAVLEGPSGLPEPGALQPAGEPIHWIADNRMKGVSPEMCGVTIHAGPAFSRSGWNRPDAQVAETLLEAAQPVLASKVASWQLHRWRYAQPVTIHPGRCLATLTPAPLVFAGDAFGGPKVEGAALSGMAAGKALVDLLP